MRWMKLHAVTWGDHDWEHIGRDLGLEYPLAECTKCGDCNNATGDGFICCTPRRKCPGYGDHDDRTFPRWKTWWLHLRWTLWL